MLGSRSISLALVLALLAAGCGDDDEPASTAPPETKAPTAAVADACELLTGEDVSAALGRTPRPDERSGRTIDGFALSQCVWEEGERTVAAAVIASPERYRQHERRGRGEAVEGVGEAALVETGMSLEDRGGTGGRTVFVLDGGRTLVVALRRGREEQDVTVDEVVGLARSAHGRLP